MSSSSSQGGHVVPWRRLITLVVLIVALVVALLIGSLTGSKSRWTPDFALDLEGGTQIILTPTTTDGSKITQDDINQAIEIIRQRVDASGVAEAEIASQGGQNIVVGLPGTPSQDTLELVRTSAVLRMRPVLTSTYAGKLTPEIVQEMTESTSSSSSSTATATASSTASSEATPSSTASSASASASASSSPKEYTEAELKAEAKKLADFDGDGKISDKPSSTPENASDTAWVTEKVYYDSLLLDCTDEQSKLGVETDDPDQPLAACDYTNGAKYILGPAEIEGTEIKQASSGFNQQSSKWVVSLTFNSKGADAFSDVTSRLVDLDSPRNQFGIVLDGRVISAPAVNEAITNGQAEISGSFTSQEVTTLANQLNFGSLPLNFEVQSEEQVSATLGTESLTSGLIAGLIGLVLVVLYLLWQYHGLGFVASGSVILATGISYLLVCLLSWVMGYRLSMAGVVGLIISVGVTADSFIVFFERIRDEIREGRSLKAAVEHGWHRAKRTIFVADGVNLLAAVVLYFLAVGSVRGFAFTLGLTTVIDLVVVMMFTYPVMTLLVRTKFFGEGHRFSGMDPEALGRTPAYRGRADLAAKAHKRTVHAKDTEDAASASAQDSVSEQIARAVEGDVESEESAGSAQQNSVPAREGMARPAPETARPALEAEEGAGDHTLSLAERRARARRAAKAQETDSGTSDGEEAR